MQPSAPNHYATLGLDRSCTDTQIRTAYRLLAKQHHPDLNHGARDAKLRTQALNAAYETLSDPDQRRAYDEETASAKKLAPQRQAGRLTTNVTKEVHLSIPEFLRGTTLEVRVRDPGNPEGAEVYELVVPQETAPGTRFCLPRNLAGGFVIVRVKARPDFRFKAHGPDLRCDLPISFQRAQQGGSESVRGATGNFLRVLIPRNVSRGEIIRISGEGLPKSRGGRGDLLVRIKYRPEIRIVRTSRR